MRQEATTPAHVLNSWKEISAFLGRGVRTAQRWERLHKLPVYRVGQGQRSPVFAYTSELSLWLHNISKNQSAANQPPESKTRLLLLSPPADRADARHVGRPRARATRELIRHSSRLTRNLLTLTAQHHQRAEILMQTVGSIANHLRVPRQRTPLQQVHVLGSGGRPNLVVAALPVLPKKPKHTPREIVAP